MKRFGKIISAVVLSLVLCLSLAGCNVYFDYDKALPYNNVYEEIKLGKLVSLLEEQKSNSTENEITYVMYVSKDHASAANAVVTIDEQAKQYGVSKVYYLDCTSYYKNTDKANDVEEKLQIKDGTVCPAVLMYVDGDLKVDWTRTSTKNSYNESLTRLASDIFYKKVNELQ